MPTESAATMFGRSKRLCQSHDADRKVGRGVLQVARHATGSTYDEGATADAGMEMK